MPVGLPRFPRFFARAPGSGAARAPLAALPALALVACMTGDDRPPTLEQNRDEVFFAHIDTLDIVGHVAPSAASPGVLVRRSKSERCEDGRRVQESADDTSLYAVTGGVLRLWTEGDCLASRLIAEEAVGGSQAPGDGAARAPRTSIWGAWTLDGQDSVPRAWRPDACPADELDYATGPTGSWEFAPERAVLRTNGAFCVARVYAENVSRALGGFEVSKGCDEVVLRVGRGEATLSSEIVEDGVRLRLAREGAETCEGLLPMALRPPPTCPAPGKAPNDAPGRPPGPPPPPPPPEGLDALSGCVADFFLEFHAETPR